MKDEIDTDAEVFDGWSVVHMQCKCVCRLSSSWLWDLRKKMTHLANISKLEHKSSIFRMYGYFMIIQELTKSQHLLQSNSLGIKS